MNAFPIVLALAALAAAAPETSAQTVYRCGNEYSRAPCKDGRTIDADGRTADQVNEARAVAARERRLGEDMARARGAQNASLRPAPARSLSPPAAPADASSAASASLKPKKKAKAKIRVVDEKDFVATEPKPPRPR